MLDLTTFLSGPFATQILADLGADVIKVESPDGDPSRAIPPHFLGEDSVYFLATNRGKRSIALDLKSPDGHRIAQRLIEQCDVVIENFRPGVAKRLGLDPEALHAGRPQLVWASISGFGQYGTMPGPQGRGHDPIATYRSFQGNDGREFVVTANTERMWRALCEAVGQPARLRSHPGHPDRAAAAAAVVRVASGRGTVHPADDSFP